MTVLDISYPQLKGTSKCTKVCIIWIPNVKVTWDSIETWKPDVKFTDILKIDFYMQWSLGWWESMKDRHISQKTVTWEFFPPKTNL